MRCRQTEAADRDLIVHFRYIGLSSPIAAERFLDKAYETFDFLVLAPRAGHEWKSRVRRLRGLRVWPVAGFPNLLVFYRLLPDEIEIVRVLHGAQDLARVLRRS